MARRRGGERPLPLQANRVGRDGFRRRALCVLTLMALAEVGSARAACAPASTSHGDTIVCSGDQTAGLVAKSGNDSISILTGASIGITGTQSATAVDAGSGNDSVVNDGRVSVTLAPPAVAPAGKSSSCSANGDVQGVGITGGGGNDLVNNRGTIAVQTSAAAGTQPPQCDSSRSESKYDDDHGHPPVKPAGVSIGILGDSGNDQISNSGSLTVSASSEAGSPQATAKGIVGGNGNDVIANTGTISVAASGTVTSSTQTDTPVSLSSKGWHSSKPQDISQSGSVTAVGIEGGKDKDNIDNSGTLTVTASATMSNSTPSLTLTGGDNVTATTTLDTRAVGIDAGTSNDRISNSGTVTANATSGIDDVNVKLSLIDLSRADTSTLIRSSATGIDAGAGNDDIGIANGGSVAASATSSSKSVAVNVSIVDASTADTKLQIESTATGIAGGQGRNTISSSGPISATATSQLSAVDVGVNFVDATVFRPPSDSSTTLGASATGIDGRKGTNDISIAAAGSVNATATSTAHSTGVSVGFLGIPNPNDVVTLIENGIADVGITSNSAATGIAGGSQRDSVTNQGSVTAAAVSTATQTAVSVGIGLVDVLVPIPDLSLVGAGTKADARATGIDAGRGDDVIVNSGLVKSDATASASTVGVSFSLSVFSVGPQALPVSAGLTAADVSTTASAQTVGIAGGSGDDSIRNTGQVQAQATATGGAVAVAASVNMEFEKGESTFGLDVVAARAVTESTAKAVGIDGGSGRNELQNDGGVTAGARANATAVGVALAVEGNVQGAAGLISGTATDTSSTASAEATGVRGGGDDDRIHNSGNIAATANANVTSVSASVGVAIAKQGLVADVGLARAQSNATATATGIDGAGGRDEIGNTGTVGATAKADANAVAVSIGVEGTTKGVAGGAALTDTTTTATATATGIKGGGTSSSDRDHDDEDWYQKHGDSKNAISNAGAVSADAQAQALSVSASVNVAIAEKGLALAGALARAESIATANATGIDAAGGSGEIENTVTGAISATSKATADAVGVAVSVAGTKQGVAGDAALTDTSTTATATATGIKGGGAKADDRDHDDKDWYHKHDDAKNGIANAGAINADAQAQALSVSASVAVSIAKEGVAIGAGLARAESNAAATAIGIDGAGGDGAIENTGTIAAKATSTADAVGVSVAIAGTKQGVAGGAALTDTSTTSTATAIGIRSGATAEDRDDGKDKDGHDKHDDKDGYGYASHDDDRNGSITNAKAISVDAQANALSVSASANVSIAKDGVALGAALADTSAHATGVAKGIEAGSGNDEVNNDGTISVKAGASGTAVSVALTVEGTAKGLAAGAALVDASVHASSTAIGVDGGAGDDRITNRGAISIDKGASSATAVGVAASVLVAKQGAALGAALADTSATAVTVATGIAGGAGNDALTNMGAITAQNVTAGATAVAVSLDVALSSQGVGAGAALANSNSTANAAATGLDGGSGNDELLNQGGITLQTVKGDSTAVSVSLAIAGAQEGLALSAALVDATATATTTATGMAGGTGNDKLTNVGTIVANDIKADANAVGVSVSATFSQTGAVAAAALAKTGTTANSTAKGLDGGAGEDSLYNSGSVTLQQVKADAGAVSVSVGLSGAEAGVTIAAGLADASGKAFATATGMDGGADNDTLVNSDKAKINVEDIGASGHAAGISVALSGSSVGVSAGAALADTSGNATSTAKGMDGGTGNDALLNEGAIALKRTTADADSTSVSVSLTASLSAGVAAGAALSRAGATANATAIGMDGGGGNDWMLNRGSVALDGVTANATAVGVSAQLGVADAGVAIGAALADTRSTANATAKGMDGGTGDDWLKNEGQITLQNVKADAGAVSVSATLNGAITGGVAAGVALVDGRSTAEAAATGMDGGAGRDVLVNTGAIKVQGVESNAHAVGVAVTANVSMAGVAAGAALSDTSATARTAVKGMDGGSGDDKITNTGTIDVQGKSKAATASVSVNFSVALGVAAGAELSRTNSVAETTAIGIDAGSGRDEISNTGSIAAKAEAESKGAAVSVGVSVGIGGDATLAEAKTSATATAVGINQVGDDASGGGMPYAKGHGDHDDRDRANVIENKGAVSANATSKSTGTSVSVNLHGLAMGDTTNTSTAEAVGIRMGDGKDQILNEGAIATTSDATASGLSVSVTGAGKSVGDASTTAQAGATGIQTAGGNDEIDNRAAINASARSTASAITVSVGLAGVTEANASTKSLATAVGIDGGSGKDTIVNRASVTASAGDAAADAAADCSTAGGACASSSSVSVTLAGTGSVDATTTARSTATGIAGGADDDSIYSDGAINASARAKIGANGVNVGIFGATQSSIDTTAAASATGVSGGDGNDVIETHSTIKAASAAHIGISGSGFTFGGSGGFNATLSATAVSTAIDGGAGNDTIQSDAALAVSAVSTLTASNGSSAAFGSSGSNTISGALSDAAGIRAGAGDDQVWNGGAIDVRATASVSLSSSSFTFGGTGGTNVSLTASTQATGIAGGSGRDSITNRGDLGVSASSSLVSSGGSNVAFGSTGAGGNSGAVTTATGIDGGDDDDVIHNKGRVTASSTASLSMDNSSFSFGGTDGTNGSLTASTRATGIAGGRGRDGIMNEGELNVSASSSLVSSGGSNVAFGTSGAGANSGAVTTVSGIDGGDDDDVIVNKGRITASSSASLSLSSSSFSFGGTGGTSGSLTASTQATGIAGGKGRDSIANEGELNVGATSTQVSSGGSNVAFGTSGAGANSGAVTNAIGIDGGDDDDVIVNKGRINASSSASLNMDNSSFSFGGTGGTSGSLTASTQSTGIAGGKGRDSITNEGELNVSASSSLVSTGGSSVGFGSSGAGSDSGAVTTTVGIDGGGDDDAILNKGRVTVSADATLHMDSSSFSFAGGGGVSGTLTATTRSVGVQGGDGSDAIQNDGDVVVRANADLRNNGSVSTSLGGAADATGAAASTVSARGIDGGAGDNWIVNNGTIDVKAAANTVSTLSSSSGFFAGQSTTIASSRADITAVGIDVGHGNNTLLNAGSIAVELSGFVSTTANSDGSSLGADADSNSRSALTATAVGIRAGDGANQITNTGSIDVKTWKAVDFLDFVFEIPIKATADGHGEGHASGDATVFIGAETNVSAAGISAGNGANIIRNDGSIAVDLRATTSAFGSTDPGSLGGDGESHSDTVIFARAVGIAAGDGANQITNTGSIKVITELGTRSDTSAIGHTTGDADALSTAKTTVFAAGIDAGNGSNTIRNEGAIDVALGATAATFTNTDAGSTGSNFDFQRASVSAQGYGIHAGSGNNTIVNKGTINVTVTGTASLNFTSCNCTASVAASAIGIGTGAGNDTIVNEGRISATKIINGVTSPGIAISSGAGDDVVTLKNGSVTNGTIDLGTGNNRLVLEGTPVINGPILDGSGSLNLVFNTAGSFAGGLPGVSATKNGPGTFTLSTLTKMQRIEINQGTLKLDSDYTFMSNGMFQARVGGDGTYGQFHVNGQAALDGTLKIVRGGGAYVNGAAFDVLTAGNGIQTGTKFSRIELPEETRLLKFHTEQNSSDVTVKADVASFTTVARTPNQMAVAGNLDRILPRTSGSLNQLLGSIQAMPDGQFASAFASMSPAVYAGYSASTFNGMQQYANVLQDRMTALRAGDLSSSQGGLALKEPIRLAYAGKGLSDLLDAGEAERARSSGLWLRGFSQKGEQNATDGASGYDYRMAGTSFGYDHRFTGNLTAGVSLGVAKNRTNVDSNVSQGDIDSTMGSVYAGYFDRRIYVNGVLSGGRNKYDTNRTNTIDQSTISSSHTGDVLSAALGAGFYAKLDTWWLEPFATAQFTRLKEKAFSETGNGAMDIPARTSDGVVSTLGARLSRPIEDGNGATWVPQASLAWLHDYSKTQVINASYVGAPDSSFSIDGQPVQRNGALLGFAISYRSKGGMTTTFQYTGEFRDQFRAHGLAGEFRFEF